MASINAVNHKDGHCMKPLLAYELLMSSFVSVEYVIYSLPELWLLPFYWS